MHNTYAHHPWMVSRSQTSQASPVARRPTNVSLPERLVEEAKALGVNISRASEMGVLEAVRAERERRWRSENREAIAAYNDWIEEHGIPLAEFRQF